MTPHIHVVSIHWATSMWLSVQQRQLAQHLDVTRTTLWLGLGGGMETQVPGAEAPSTFAAVHHLPTTGRHADNLDLVIAQVMTEARDEDLLVVLDQDAFPMASLEHLLDEVSCTRDPAAAVRFENNGDSQPHPLFFVSTVGVWRRLEGTWREGPVRLDGLVRSDVGGVLLRQLYDAGLAWKRLVRTADSGAHPILYAVYGDVVYHHGAGSRPVWTDADARRIYRNRTHRVVDALLFRTSWGHGRSLRYRTQELMAAGHQEETRLLLADPEAYVARLVRCQRPEA